MPYGSTNYGQFPLGGGPYSYPAFGGVTAVGTVGIALPGRELHLVGLVATGAVGTVAAGGGIGVAAIGRVGNFKFAGQTRPIGIEAIGDAGDFSFDLIRTLPSVSATGTVSLSAEAGPAIKGVQARGTAEYIDNFNIDIVYGLVGWSGFTRRDGDAYGYAFADLFPTGQAWPRERSTTFMGAVYGLADYWGFVDSRAADLLEIEADPRTTHELLPDWERAWGLPDPCLEAPQTEQQRRDMLVEKIIRLGAQSRDWFWRFARVYVGTKIYIQEFAPFTCGLSQVGDTRPGPEGGWEQGHYRWEIGRPEIRFFWRVQPLGKTLHWFRCGRDNCGEDPMCRILPDIALECILRRLKPAMTEIVFDYSLSTEE